MRRWKMGNPSLDRSFRGPVGNRVKFINGKNFYPHEKPGVDRLFHLGLSCKNSSAALFRVHRANTYLQYFSQDLASRVRRRHCAEVRPSGRLQGHANTLWLFPLPVSIRGGLPIPKSPPPLLFYLFKGNLLEILGNF